jgi:hypothetical protein
MEVEATTSTLSFAERVGTKRDREENSEIG